MADKTSFLELLLPGFGEYVDAWWDPLNDNFTAIDGAIESVTTEVINARQGKTTLLAFLQVGINSNGTLKATAEATAARNSFVYGHRDPVTTDLYALKDRLNQGDKETWYAREGQAALLDSLAFRTLGVNKSIVVGGTKNANGYPTWMGYTGANVSFDGSVTPIEFLIDGKYARIRTNKTVTLTAPAGVKYLWAQYQATGVITVDGDSTTPPPASANGTTSLDLSAEATLFTDVTKDFTTEDVEVGDLLTLLNGGDAGDYIIAEVAPGGSVTQLKILGLFPVGGLSSINYTIRDRFAVTLGFDTSVTPAAGKIYLGEAYFDGAAVATIPGDTVAIRPKHFLESFVGEWRAVDVSGGSPTFEEVFRHELGGDVLDVSVQVSQADDGTAPVEELSTAQIGSTLGFTPDNGTLSIGIGSLAWSVATLAVSPVGLSAGDQTVTTQPALTGAAALTGVPTLTGTVGGSLTGSVAASRSAAVKWDKNRVWIKNPHSAVFYKDYANVVRQTGFLRVVVRKRG